MTKTDFTPTIIAKKAAGLAAANLIQDGMTVGLGTGSTASFFIEALGKRCQEGLHIQAAATSEDSKRQAMNCGIPIIENNAITHLDITVDGADEIDKHKNMIKGGGGALLKEKILAHSSSEMIVIIDENKLVDQLGAFPVPVEVAQFASYTTLQRLKDKGYNGKFRLNRNQSYYLTENGNFIIDINFSTLIVDPIQEHHLLKNITGVLETGFFFGIAGRVIVGYEDGYAKINL